MEGDNRRRIASMSPEEFRGLVRKGEWKEENRDACQGYAFAGLAILPKQDAYDFLVLCLRNPRPLPVLDITEPGDPHPRLMAPSADLRTDFPQYRVIKDGAIIDEPTDVKSYWRDDLVGFLLGCSIGIQGALDKASVKYRFNGIFNTNIQLHPAGPFHGRMAVSARTFSSSEEAVRAVQISSRLLASHGPPVHIGSPSVIGIKDMNKPDFPLPYQSAPPGPQEIPLFWACAVTPQNVALESKIPFMIMQRQGCLLPIDKRVDEVSVL
jgi:uncharacterized protein YcsI (UPF0317 family)